MLNYLYLTQFYMNKLIKLKNDFENKIITKQEYIKKMYSEFHSVLFDYANNIWNTDISKIEIVENEIIMTFRDSWIKLICNENDERIPPIEAINFGNYESEEMEMQLKLINSGDTVFDIWANIWRYSTHIAKLKSNIKVFSFEPIPNTYKCLLENIKINNLKNIETFNFWFADTKGSFEFYCDSSLSANASLANVSNNEKINKIKCNIEKLDDFTKNKKIKIDFIKCDVEWAEFLVFKGGIDTIKNNLPIVFSEMLRKWMSKFDHHPNQLINLFKEIGYECFILDNEKLKILKSVDENTIQTNYFFLHKEKHLKQIQEFSV